MYKDFSCKPGVLEKAPSSLCNIKFLVLREVLVWEDKEPLLWGVLLCKIESRGTIRERHARVLVLQVIQEKNMSFEACSSAVFPFGTLTQKPPKSLNCRIPARVSLPNKFPLQGHMGTPIQPVVFLSNFV